MLINFKNICLKKLYQKKSSRGQFFGMTDKKRPASASSNRAASSNKGGGSKEGYKVKRPMTASASHSNSLKKQIHDKSQVTPYGTTNSEQYHSCKYLTSYMKGNVWVNSKTPSNYEPMSRSRAQSTGNFRAHPELVFYKMAPGTDQFLTGGRKKFPVHIS